MTCVYVVDNGPSMRPRSEASFARSICMSSSSRRLRSSSGTKRREGPSCLVLDIRLPGVSGLDFQAQLQKTDIRIPIVFMTGHGDIPMSVRASIRTKNTSSKRLYYFAGAGDGPR
jgi:FixJ family two-component response regulator